MRRDLLVPRRLVPAEAVLEALAPLTISSEHPGLAGDSIVPRFLVPQNAMIVSIVATNGSRVPAQKDIFQDSVLAKAPLGHRHNPAKWLISIGIHAAIITAAFIVPLYYTQTIDTSQLETTFLGCSAASGCSTSATSTAGSTIAAGGTETEFDSLDTGKADDATCHPGKYSGVS